MSLLPKPFHELLNMKFIIPPYQRGYRWDSEQVETLLNDLQDFIKKYVKVNANAKNQSVPYYCLQPIAVVKDFGNQYIVVDGQQRLTTIYLLLHYLRNKEEWDYPIYSLEMPSRNIQNDYLNKELFKDSNSNFVQNIDTFYIRKAYESIINWFAKDKHRSQNKPAFRNLFAYEPDEDEKDINRDVRVIWYEISSTTALDAFRRLNYGKIPLTSTELVKALLLQSENNPASGEHTRGAAYRRALEWDSMEHTLQNPYLWAMLSDQSQNTLSHLDIILDFVADRLNSEMIDTETNKKPFTRKDKNTLSQPDMRDYFNYNVVNEFMHRSGDKAVEIIWDSIRQTFNLIVNWYDNREWYHLIGLLRILPEKKKRKDSRSFIKYIYELSFDKNHEPVSRPQFKVNLRKEIGKLIRLDSTPLEKLSYNDNRISIIQILTLLNVYEVMKDQTEENRFAFHLFEQFNVTSLEHIHPQNITSDASYDDFSEWVSRRSGDFFKLEEKDIIKVIMKDDVNLEDETILENIKAKATKVREETCEAIKTLKRLTITQKIYADGENKDLLNAAATKLDKFFGELSGINESELHSISNLALIDQPTNSALQNYFLDQKRDLLMTRHQHCNAKTMEGTYAPPATRRVFCKGYSRFSPGDMRLWRREDRSNYFNQIQEVYNYFTTND